MQCEGKGGAASLPRSAVELLDRRSDAEAERVAVAANNVRRIRESLMMSKAELARKAGLSTLTIDRVEAGKACRLDTRRKILQALGLRVADKESVFGAPLGEAQLAELRTRCSESPDPAA
jgi:DNA-binding XRE family transcriptional regulator